MSGLPTPVKSWTAGMLVNQRITFVTLLTTLGTYVTGITNRLIAKGYTCAGSSDGTTAAMDTVNRCTIAAGFAIRGANTTSSQSWIVVTAANGVQTCFAYVGGSDDIARVSFSPGGLFVVAGTATNTPTATDEQIICTTTLIGNTASADRLFNVWVDSTHNMWRACCIRGGVLVGSLIRVELFDSSPLAGVTIAVSVWGGCQAANFTQTLANVSGAFSANSVGGLCKTSGNANTQLGGAVLVFNGDFANDDGQTRSANGTLFPIRTWGLASTSAGCQGLVGIQYDSYKSSDSGPCGGVSTDLKWVLLNNTSTTGSGGILWPWDGSTATCVTA